MATKELVDTVFKIANDRNSVIRLLTMAKSAIRHNMSNDIPHLDFPVCLVWGKQDNVTPPEVAKEFHSLFKRSELYWIDKCGHSPMWEHPEEFSKILCSPRLAEVNFCAGLAPLLHSLLLAAPISATLLDVLLLAKLLGR